MERWWLLRYLPGPRVEASRACRAEAPFPLRCRKGPFEIVALTDHERIARGWQRDAVARLAALSGRAYWLLARAPGVDQSLVELAERACSYDGTFGPFRLYACPAGARKRSSGGSPPLR
ncbi:MAG: hypothetical protein AABZ30_08480 [Myxococcota bacterium]